MDRTASNGGVYGPLLGLITPMGNPCAGSTACSRLMRPPASTTPAQIPS